MGVAGAAGAADDDSYLWLEDVQGDRTRRP
jgi:hypothetical protein